MNGTYFEKDQEKQLANYFDKQQFEIEIMHNPADSQP